MDCADVHAAIRSGGPLSPAHARHLTGCEACRTLALDHGALAQALERAGQGDGPGLEALLARVDADLASERGLAARLRERPTPVRIVLAALAAAIVPVLVVLFGPRPDLSVYPVARMLLDVVLVSLPAALALWVGLRPLHRPALPGWASPVLVAAAVLAMLVVVVLPEAHHDHPASLLGVGEDFAKRARGCFVMGVACGVPALVWLRLSSRDTGRFAITGALAVSAALAGALAVYLHCPIVATAHLLAGHATVLVPYFLVAALLGRRARG